jgi:hypothetical protein
MYPHTVHLSQRSNTSTVTRAVRMVWISLSDSGNMRAGEGSDELVDFSLLSGRAQTFQAFALACRHGQLIRQKVCAQCIQYRFHFRKLLDFGTLALSLLADRPGRPVRQDLRSDSSLCHEYFLLETTSEIYSIGGQK